MLAGVESQFNISWTSGHISSCAPYPRQGVGQSDEAKSGDPLGWEGTSQRSAEAGQRGKTRCDARVCKEMGESGRRKMKMQGEKQKAGLSHHHFSGSPPTQRVTSLNLELPCLPVFLNSDVYCNTFQCVNIPTLPHPHLKCPLKQCFSLKMAPYWFGDL